MKQYIKNHPFLTCICIQLIIFILYCISGTIKYEVSDDFMMQMMVSGAYGSTANDMMFTSPILAIILSFLYQILPFVNWYFYFQAGMIVISLSIIHYIFIKEKHHPLLQSIVFACILLIAKDFYQLMQFTKTATIILCAASLLAIYAMKNDKKQLISAIILLIVGMMLRLKCIYIVGPALAGYVLIDFITHKDEFKAKLKSYLLLAICAILSYGFVNISQSILENRTDLIAYDTFNHERVSINDVEAIDYTLIQEELNNIGVSENDYQMMLSWNFGDEDYFTTETLGKVADIMERHQNRTFKDALYSMVHRQYWNYMIVWFIMITGILCCIMFKSLPQGILLGGICFILLLINSYASRNVYRVEVSTFISCILFYYYANQDQQFKSSKWFYIPSICMIVLSIVGLIPIHSQSNYDMMNASWDNNIKKYQVSFRQTPLPIVEEIQNHPQNTYILGFNSCIQSFYLHYDPVFENGSTLFHNAIYLGGVDFQHPLRNYWMSEHHLENTITSLLEDDVYFVEHHTQNQILTFFHEHYDANITMELVKEVEGYQIWKFHQPE